MVKRMQECAKVINSMQGCARVCRSMPMWSGLCKCLICAGNTHTQCRHTIHGSKAYHNAIDTKKLLTVCWKVTKAEKLSSMKGGECLALLPEVE